MVIISSNCANCREEFVWKSQPYMPSTKIAAVDLLLSYSILAGGGSASKVIQIFDHMGVQCISMRTFFKHQHVSDGL